MADVTLTRSGELMITQAIGNTEAGVDFIDAWPYPQDGKMYVHDAGHIMVSEEHASRVEKAAVEMGLTVEHDVIASEKR